MWIRLDGIRSSRSSSTHPGLIVDNGATTSTFRSLRTLAQRMVTGVFPVRISMARNILLRGVAYAKARFWCGRNVCMVLPLLIVFDYDHLGVWTFLARPIARIRYE